MPSPPAALRAHLPPRCCSEGRGTSPCRQAACLQTHRPGGWTSTSRQRLNRLLVQVPPGDYDCWVCVRYRPKRRGTAISKHASVPLRDVFANSYATRRPCPWLRTAAAAPLGGSSLLLWRSVSVRASFLSCVRNSFCAGCYFRSNVFKSKVLSIRRARSRGRSNLQGGNQKSNLEMATSELTVRV